jgi:hypothetical protein
MISSNAFTDKTAVSQGTLKAMQSTAKLLEFEMSTLQFGMATIPNTSEALHCVAWLKDYFEKVGEKQPNCDNGKDLFLWCLNVT